MPFKLTKIMAHTKSADPTCNFNIYRGKVNGIPYVDLKLYVDSRFLLGVFGRTIACHHTPTHRLFILPGEMNRINLYDRIFEVLE